MNTRAVYYPDELAELDPRFADHPSLEELGIGGEDDWQIEYRGYETDESDYDLPWKEYTPPMNWDDIPF